MSLGRKNYSVDLNFFKSIDSESKAYALGFLLTDGSVEFSGNRFYFKSTDKDIIEKLKSALSYTGPILFQKREKPHWKDSWKLQISRRSMVQDLANLGIFNGNINAPWIDLNNESLQWHFIRGLIDGDGSLSIDKSQGLGISSLNFQFKVSSFSLVEGFSEFLDVCGLHSNITFYNRKNMKDMYVLRLSGNKAFDFIEKSYFKASIFMDRKYNFYEKVKNTSFSDYSSAGFERWRKRKSKVA